MRTIFITASIVGLICTTGAPALANATRPEPLPAAIFTDPAPDIKHPARMEVLKIPSGGSSSMAFMAAYLPGGRAAPDFGFVPWLAGQ